MNLKYAVRSSFWKLGLDLVKDEPDTSLPSFMRMLIPRLGINCVLDVGAHRGEYARMLRIFGYRGRIVSFEPVAENYAILTELAANDPAWDVRHMALGSEDGEAEINVTENTVFSSFLTPVDERVSARQSVSVRRLDGVFAEVTSGIREPRAFLKMDTQGFDLEVVRGAAGCLGQIPAAQSEMSVVPIYDGSPGFAEALAELESHGFHLSAMFPVLRRGLRLVEFDCVMAR